MERKLPRITYEEDDESGETAPPASYFECSDCHIRSPPTRTGETLVSSKHGWRAVRVTTSDGSAAEWRCPTCWTSYRASKLASF